MNQSLSWFMIMTSYFQASSYHVISQKSLRLSHFISDQDEIWHYCHSS